MTARLALRLRSETRALHIAAERSSLMRSLLRGELPRSAYCALLRNLHAIYAALEPALERHASHPHIAPIALPGLGRLASLEDDLRLLHGTAWRDELTLGQCASAYARRLQEIDVAQPGLLLAHAYVRYLGDLSGGQMLASTVARGMGLADGLGTAFYAFGDSAHTNALARAFREGLGGITPEPAVADQIVDEAAWSFRMHRRLFVEIAAAENLGGRQAPV